MPNARVDFTGQPERQTVWEADRENLPDEVRPGVAYRDIGIRLRITSVFADIDRIVAEALGEVPGLGCAEPEGAFYAFPDVRGCLGGELKTSADFADRLLREAHTVVTDGAGFGAEGYVRISYATSMERLEEGIRRVRRVAEKYAR